MLYSAYFAVELTDGTWPSADPSLTTHCIEWSCEKHYGLFKVCPSNTLIIPLRSSVNAVYNLASSWHQWHHPSPSMAIASPLVFDSFTVKIMFLLHGCFAWVELSFYKGCSHEAGMIILDCLFRLSLLSLIKQTVCVNSIVHLKCLNLFTLMFQAHMTIFL